MKKKVTYISKSNKHKPFKFNGFVDALIGRIKFIFADGKRYGSKAMYRYMAIFLVLFSLLAVPAIESMVSMNESSVELIQSEGTTDFDSKEKYEKENHDEKIELQVSRSNDDNQESSNLLSNFALKRFVSDFKKDIPIPPPELS